MSIILALATMVLILTSFFLILVVLMQKAKSDGGMGAAMGGGMAEATFGAETGNVLSTWTIRASIVFFVVSFGLYLGHIYERKHATGSGAGLPTISGPAAPSSLPSVPPRAGTPASPTPAPAH